MKIKIRFTDMPFGFDAENNCYMQALRKHYSVEISEKPDFVFYSVFGTEFIQFFNSVRIFLALEPVLPNFNDCDYAIGTSKLSFEGRYFRTPPFTDYGEDALWESLLEEREVSAEDAKRKFCNFIYSNENNGEGARLRKRFCRELMKYRHVDCPGSVLNNMENVIEPRYFDGSHFSEKSFNSRWIWSKLEFLQNYKFGIAFENSAMPGWTTEKLIHPMMAKNIPIYWGNPDVAEYFNPKSFINCADYGDDFSAVIQRILELDQDEEQYLDMLSQCPLSDAYPLHWKNDMAEYLSEIIDSGVKPFDKNPMGFQTVTAQDYASLCRTGKVGMKKIVRDTVNSVAGWLSYKWKK